MPHASPVDVLAHSLGVDPQEGLGREEVARRQAADGPNELDRVEKSGWWVHALGQCRDPLVALLLFAIVVSLAAWGLDGGDGVPFDAIVIGAIVVLNAGIGAVQAVRAETAVAALRRLAATQAHVLRDGELVQIEARDVVMGDVLIVGEGDAVAADARLFMAPSLRLSEASLTGESEPVSKSLEPTDPAAPLGDRHSMIHAGTAVASGRGRAVVVAIGMETEVGSIATLLGETERQKTPLEREIAKVGAVLGVVVMAIAALVVTTLLVVSDLDAASDVIDALLVGVSLAVAAVPEGLPAVLSIVLALGVQRMADRNALVKRLASAETLGSATTICTDKTGTLTRGEMTVRTLVAARRRVHIDGTGYEPRGSLTVGGEPLGSDLAAVVRAALRAGATASNAGIELMDGRWVALGDPTEASVVVACAKNDGGLDAVGRVSRLDEIAFTSERKRMSVLVDDPDRPGAGLTLVVKGAPDELLDRCASELTERGEVDLDDEGRRWWRSEIDSLAEAAMRTLLIARRDGVSAPITGLDERELVLLGVVGIIDLPRKEALAAVTAAQAGGVRVVMVTGDHPRTAAQIAREVGILTPSGEVVEGGRLETLSDAELASVARTTSVFARVAPAHKLRLVQALQAQGEVVAMTGDGVNDGPALKAADIGTAMGIAGTDVAREAADMILIDDDFATIVVAISEGRGIFHNIRSFLRYLLSSNIGEVLTVFLGILLAGVVGLDGDGILVPLTATQILWINLLTDTGPALALGVDPLDRRLMQRPPRRSSDRVIDAAMWRGIALIGATMAAVTLLMFDAQRPGGLIEGTGSIDEARTAAFTVLVLAQLFNCFSARSDEVSAFRKWAVNRWLLAAVAVALALQVVVVHVPLMNDAFATGPMTLVDWIWSALLASVVLWVSEIRKWVRRRR